MALKNKKYRVVKLKDSIHCEIKHMAVDLKLSIQDIVERAVLKFLQDMSNKEKHYLSG